ncbi:DMT family transporter [Massilia sp.]|uniref:DMT family transporter n=1 Tax=Massilia sp. TaxID=1882437 RepID=UPI00289E2995|nr:DMT family transporter [Massilia sp.]
MNHSAASPSEPAATTRRTLIVVLTAVAMLAFAANSLLARLAFQTSAIDAAGFTAIRIIAGALTLLAIARLQRQPLALPRGAPYSAALLFVYAAAFSFAYRDIGTGAGALVLFASAQLVMIGYGLVKGERASVPGLLLALGGLAAFLLPSASSPPLGAALLMALAGCAWGGFSLLGRTAGPPVINTAASFLLAVPLALALLLLQRDALVFDPLGAAYAVVSGSITSALGYAVWYWVRSRLSAIGAGAVQLSVPVIGAVMGLLFLGERMSAWSVGAGLATLAGVAWVMLSAKKAAPR